MKRPRVNYRECKLLGHSWETYAPVVWRGIYSYDVLHLTCTRCSTNRHDAFDVYGNLISRKYEYPDNYRDSVDTKPTRAQLRLTMSKRRK